MTARLAVHLEAHQLPELQRAARCLLRTPLVTATDPDFRLVRRWESVLRREFAQKFGFRLDVARSSARLLRRPASLSIHRPARLETGRALNRLSYVYLCLTLAAIEQPGHQLLASELVARIEQGARGDERLRIDLTDHAHRRALRDAVRYLEQLGVLRVRDGDVETIVADGQVLFDIDRDTAEMCMVASPSILREVDEIADFVTEPVPMTIEGRRRAARHRLNRRMIDQPLVRLDDLDDDEAELAWRNRRREAENVSRLTGCTVELRREGLALIDHPRQPLGGRSFPAADSVAHGALLLIDALLAEVTDPEAALDAETSSRRVTSATVDACWDGVVERYGERFAKPARDRPTQFRSDCLDLLVAFGLVRRAVHGDPDRPSAGKTSDEGNGALDIDAFAARFRVRPELAEPAVSPRSQRPNDTLF